MVLVVWVTQARASELQNVLCHFPWTSVLEQNKVSSVSNQTWLAELMFRYFLANQTALSSKLLPIWSVNVVHFINNMSLWLHFDRVLWNRVYGRVCPPVDRVLPTSAVCCQGAVKPPVYFSLSRRIVLCWRSPVDSHPPPLLFLIFFLMMLIFCHFHFSVITDL